MLTESLDGLGTIREFRAIVHTETGPIAMKEFAEFFRLFRMTYAVTMVEPGTRAAHVSIDASESLENIVHLTTERIKLYSTEEMGWLDTRPLEVEPTILTIHRENPLLLILGGLAVAFAAATILSGGKFKMPGLEVELPPLGQGIEALKKAWRF
jgi:hypothetical protein